MRESFFRAATILDPEWIQTYNNDKDGIKNISTIEAKGLDIEDNLSPNSVRKNVDQLISRLASSPSQSPKNVPQNQGDVPQNTENTTKNQRDVLKNQENVPKNHQNLSKIQGNVSDEEELFPKDTISDPPENSENPETSRNSAKKRKVPNIDEISQHIDYAHVKRSNFDRGIQPKDIYEMLMQTDDSDE